MGTAQQIDSTGAPLIEESGSKIKVLTRRLIHLRRQLSTWDEARGGSDFVRKEAAALKAGIAALTFHRAQMKGLDTVATALEDLVDAVKADGVPGVDAKHLGAAMERAKVVLAEWEGG